MTLQELLTEIATNKHVTNSPATVEDIPIDLIVHKRINQKTRQVELFRVAGVQEYQVPVWTNLKEPHNKFKIKVQENVEGGKISLPSTTFEEYMTKALEVPSPDPFETALFEKIASLKAADKLLTVLRLDKYSEDKIAVLQAIANIGETTTEILKTLQWKEGQWIMKDYIKLA